MSFFRPHHSESEINSSRDEVIASLEKSGLDKSSLVVLGGSALALEGIRPAGDLDVMITGQEYAVISTDMRTPSGLHLRKKVGARHPFLETAPQLLPAGVLGFDITHPHDDMHHAASPDLDHAFLKNADQLPSIAGFRYLTPALVAMHKEDLGRRKDRQDRRLISNYLRRK